MTELDDIALWCEETFGPILPQRLVSRAQEEMNELRAELQQKDEWTDAAKEEAADVIIILSRVPGLMEAVRKKMDKNKEREWNFHGDGTGYRRKESLESNDRLVELIREQAKRSGIDREAYEKELIRIMSDPELAQQHVQRNSDIIKSWREKPERHNHPDDLRGIVFD